MERSGRPILLTAEGGRPVLEPTHSRLWWVGVVGLWGWRWCVMAARTTSKVKTVITTMPDGETTSTTTVFGADEKEVTVSVEADGEVIGGGGLRANVSVCWRLSRCSRGHPKTCVFLCGGLLIGADVVACVQNYDVPSTMPPDSPVRRVDTIPLEELASHANEEGLVKVRDSFACISVRAVLS